MNRGKAKRERRAAARLGPHPVEVGQRLLLAAIRPSKEERRAAEIKAIKAMFRDEATGRA